MNDAIVLNEETPPLVLIVDDIQKNLQLLANTLYDAGYEIAMAESGKEALEFLKNTLPDLILLDVMMPELTGFDVCKILKEDARTMDTPIIFLTAKVEMESIVHGFDLGAVDYVTKPFNTSELLARVKTHIELKQAKDKLVEYNAELIKLNEKKSEFLGIAVHDLKNPLQGVLSFAELLIQKFTESEEIMKVVPDQYIHFLDYIKLSGTHMYKIVNDILNVETLESGKLKLNIQKRNLANTLINVLNSNLISAQNKKISLHLSTPTELYALADEDRMQEAFDNYVSNAIKYSPLGKNVWISLYITIKNEKKFCVLKIRDEGPGLTDKDKEKVFGRFQKLTAKPTANEPSSGLGLSIVKTIVEMHKGKVWVESEHGKGASFYLALPAEDDNYEALANYLDTEFFTVYEKAEDFVEVNDAVNLVENFEISKIADDRGDEIKEFAARLNEEFLPRWEAVYRKNILSEIRQFSRDVEALGLNNNIEVLAKYSSYLTKYAAFFEIEKVDKALEVFPKLVKKFSDWK